MTDGDWFKHGVGDYQERWVYTGSSEARGSALRIMKNQKYPSEWRIRWHEGRAGEVLDTLASGDLSLEEAQALALTLWRMR